MKSPMIPNYLSSSNDFGGLLINQCVYFVEIGPDGITFNKGILRDVYCHDKRIVITVHERQLIENTPIPKWYNLSVNDWYKDAEDLNRVLKATYKWKFDTEITNVTACAGIQNSAVLSVYKNIASNFIQEMRAICNERIKALKEEKNRITTELTFYTTWVGHD